MGSSSTILTIGTALKRAHDANAPVEVLVRGVWYDGVLLGHDTYGVVIEQPLRVPDGTVVGQTRIHVFKYDAVDGVRISGQLLSDDERPALPSAGNIETL